MLQNNTLRITTIICLCLFVKMSVAQVGIADTVKKLSFPQQTDYSITGKVTDEKGQPLQHATVYTINNNIIALTDNDGSFTIKLNPTSIKEYNNLTFGYPGKQTEVRNVHLASFPATVNVKLEPVKECKQIVTEGCCAIDISWSVDNLFEKEAVKTKAKPKKKEEVINS